MRYMTHRLERSGGPYHSKSLSDEPRNIKQIKNRKQQLKSSSKNNKSDKLMMKMKT